MMKALKFIVIGMVLFMAGAGKAQVNVNVTIGTPPPWGPAGYEGVRYHYLPDVESYYDIHANMFICYIEDAWVHRDKLPTRYKSYDLYTGYKVVLLDYNGSAPYQYFDDHKTKYAKGYRGPEQKNIGGKPANGKSKGQGNGHGKKK